jgi:hypothetical protein
MPELLELRETINDFISVFGGEQKEEVVVQARQEEEEEVKVQLPGNLSLSLIRNLRRAGENNVLQLSMFSMLGKDAKRIHLKEIDYLIRYKVRQEKESFIQIIKSLISFWKQKNPYQLQLSPLNTCLAQSVAGMTDVEFNSLKRLLKKVFGYPVFASGRKTAAIRIATRIRSGMTFEILLPQTVKGEKRLLTFLCFGSNDHEAISQCIDNDINNNVFVIPSRCKGKIWVQDAIDKQTNYGIQGSIATMTTMRNPMSAARSFPTLLVPGNATDEYDTFARVYHYMRQKYNYDRIAIWDALGKFPVVISIVLYRVEEGKFVSRFARSAVMALDIEPQKQLDQHSKYFLKCVDIPPLDREIKSKTMFISDTIIPKSKNQKKKKLYDWKKFLYGYREEDNKFWKKERNSVYLQDGRLFKDWYAESKEEAERIREQLSNEQDEEIDIGRWKVTQTGRSIRKAKHAHKLFSQARKEEKYRPRLAKYNFNRDFKAGKSFVFLPKINGQKEEKDDDNSDINWSSEESISFRRQYNYNQAGARSNTRSRRRRNNNHNSNNNNNSNSHELQGKTMSKVTRPRGGNRGAGENDNNNNKKDIGIDTDEDYMTGDSDELCKQINDIKRCRKRRKFLRTQRKNNSDNNNNNNNNNSDGFGEEAFQMWMGQEERSKKNDNNNNNNQSDEEMLDVAGRRKQNDNNNRIRMGISIRRSEPNDNTINSDSSYSDFSSASDKQEENSQESSEFSSATPKANDSENDNINSDDDIIIQTGKLKNERADAIDDLPIDKQLKRNDVEEALFNDLKCTINETNRYAEWNLSKHKNFAKAGALMSSSMSMISWEEIVNFNGKVQNNQQSLEEALRFNNAGLRSFLLPVNKIHKNRLRHPEINFASSLVGIIFKECIWGVVIFGWVTEQKDQVINEIKVRKVDIYGRAQLFKPLFVQPPAPNMVGNDIPLQSPTIIRGTEGNVSYRPGLGLHDIGYTFNELEYFVGGDYKQICLLYGMGKNPSYFCPFCLCTQSELHAHIANFNYKQWNTRFHIENTDRYLAEERTKKNIDPILTYGIQHLPLLRISPYYISHAVLHLKIGPAARILNGIFNIIESYDTADKQKSTKDEIQTARRLLEAAEKELAAVTNALDFQWYKGKEGELVADNEREGSPRVLSDLEAEEARLKNVLEEARRNLDLTERQYQASTAAAFSNFLRDKGIREYHYHQSSCIGSTAERLTNERKEIARFIRKKTGDVVAASLLEQCLIHYRFILDISTKKNEEEFSDELIIEFKRCLLEFDAAYRAFLGYASACAPMNNERDSLPLSFKLHWWKHLFEFVEYFRFSPAHIDDNRCEAFNKRIKKYWNIFGSYMCETNLLKMSCTMVREQQSYLDTLNSNTSEQVQALNERLEEENDTYYRVNFRIKGTNKPKRIESDTRYTPRT